MLYKWCSLNLVSSLHCIPPSAPTTVCPLFAYTLDLFPPTDFMLYYPLRMSPITPVLPFSSLSAGAHNSFTHKNIFSLNLHTQHCFYLSFLFILQRSLSCCGLHSFSSWYITILLTVYFVTLMAASLNPSELNTDISTYHFTHHYSLN